MKLETVSGGSELSSSVDHDAPAHLRCTSTITISSSTHVERVANEKIASDIVSSQPYYSQTGTDPYQVQSSVSIQLPHETPYSLGQPIGSQPTTTTYSGSGAPNAENQDYSYMATEVSHTLPRICVCILYVLV